MPWTSRADHARPGRARGAREPRRGRLRQVKPHLRGWLHLGTFPVALAAGIVLVVLAPTTAGQVSSAIFAATAALLFGTCALYHRGTWSPRVGGILKRLRPLEHLPDHRRHLHAVRAAAAARPGAHALLVIVWSGAVARRAASGCSGSARRAGSTSPVYIALGWVAIFYLPAAAARRRRRRHLVVDRRRALHASAASSTAPSGRTRRPRWFGFHEVFHALTVAAFAAHYVAVSIALTGPAAA